MNNESTQIESKNKKRKKTGFQILDSITDILIIPILLVAFVSSIFMMAKRGDNKMPAIFGTSIGRIKSPSMVEAGFNVGDVVFVNQKAKNDIKVGDVVVFYYVGDNLSSQAQESFTEILEVVSKSDKNLVYKQNVDEVIQEKTIERNINFDKTKQKEYYNQKSIYFHFCVGIYVDDDGVVFYKTQGGNAGASPEAYYTREDMVVGKYSNTPNWIRNVISFCGSGMGMIILVCTPLSILVFIQLLSMIEQLSIIMLERKLLNGKIKFTDTQALEKFNGNNIEPIFKVLLYYQTPKEQRDAIKQFLWSNILSADILKGYSAKEKEAVIKGEQLLKEDKVEDYFNEFISINKGRDRRKLIKMKKQLIEDEIIEDLFKKR